MHIFVESAPPSGWATLVEVSESLGVSYDMIRRVVRKAYEKQQDWVKRAPYPKASSPLRWLVNTNHELYRYHAQVWLECAHQECMASEPTNGSKSHKQKAVPGTRATRETHTPGTDIRETWPELCQWLANLGLVVYINALATEPNWQWSWDGESGSGYATATDAITAALQHRLLFGEPFFPWPTSQELYPEDASTNGSALDGERKEEPQARSQGQV